jgi:sugar (glycoside-pentoside-hexuronide) transporter
MSTTVATRERVPSARVQSVSIVTAAFGQNAVLTAVSTFITLYLVQFAHFSVQAIFIVSAILTGAKVLDAVTDPVVGSIIDRTQTRWGKMRPFILFSAVPVAALTTLLFSVPGGTETFKLVFFGVCYLLWGIAYSFCDVPLWGLIGSAFGDQAARNRVVSNVRAFGAISLGLATLGVPSLAAALSFGSTTTASGWSLAILAVSVVGFGLYLLAFFNVRERPIAAEHARLSAKQLYGTLFRNTPLLMVLIGSILGFGRNIVQVGGALFVVIAYKNSVPFPVVGGAIIVGIVLAAFLTPLLLRRVSNRVLAIASSLVGTVLYLLMFVFGFQNVIATIIFIFLTGLTLGVFLVVQATMIADAVDDVEQRTGVRNDGISFATLTFVSKLMAAAAVGVFGLFVGIAGYHDGVHVTFGMQQTVWLSLTIVPAISCLLSAVPFWFYRLGGKSAR